MDLVWTLFMNADHRFLKPLRLLAVHDVGGGNRAHECKRLKSSETSPINKVPGGDPGSREAGMGTLFTTLSIDI